MLRYLIKALSGREDTIERPFWRGAIYGLLLVVITVAGITGYHFRTGIPAILMSLAWIVMSIVMLLVLITTFRLLYLGYRRVPQQFSFGLLSVVVMLVSLKFIRFTWPNSFYYPAHAVFILINATLLGCVWQLVTGAASRWRKHYLALAVFMVIADLFVIYWFAQPGTKDEAIPLQTAKYQQSLKGVVDPSQPGDYEYEYFTYGNGTDNRRSAFAGEVRFTTNTVDATELLPEWKDKKAKWRKRYWGFGVKEFPINGRVWFPKGTGHFPLILIVHGNHSMEHHSDPGYAYLGELLASHGFITASVDENFINGTWSGDFRGKEMPTRAWLLLKHLEVWRSWSNDSSHEMNGKVDMDNIFLAGHSRGGEAVSIAAAYNQMNFFPDNAKEQFDFNFNIKGIIAIAPTDARYERRIELENINYLSLQGSYDSDEASFFGLRQWQRVQFTDSNRWFKAGVYIHGANHGQFNTIWGRKDLGVPWNWLLNLAPIIEGEDQRQFAKVYITAFVQAIANNKLEYLKLFKGNLPQTEWIPAIPTLYNYKDSRYQPLITFEEDINISSFEKGTISGGNLKTWREEELRFRNKDTQKVNVAVLGWDYGEEMEADSVANYVIEWSTAENISSATHLNFNLASLKGDHKEEDGLPPIPDFSIQLTDTLGNQLSGRLSDFGTLLRPLKVSYLKISKINDDAYGSKWEPALQDVRIDLNILQDSSQFEFGALKRLVLTFDAVMKGELALNEVGMDNMTSSEK